MKNKIIGWIWNLLNINRLMWDVQNNYKAFKVLCVQVTELQERVNKLEVEINNKLGAGAPGGQK